MKIISIVMSVSMMNVAFGGMSRDVSAYISSTNVAEVLELQSDIVNGVLTGSPKENSIKLANEVKAHIPLSDEQKSRVISLVEKLKAESDVRAKKTRRNSAFLGGAIGGIAAGAVG